jgi:molybdopterin synthase sulfur carrier subunit
VTLLYFAWVRQKIGKGEERMAPPAGDVAALIAHLKSLGPNYADAFADLSRIRVAVNQHHAGLDTKVGPDDEVAFFPPVTGG